MFPNVPVRISQIRTGLPITHAYALEPLFDAAGVDLMLWAHEHSYERMWPVYNRTVANREYYFYEHPAGLQRHPVALRRPAGARAHRDRVGS